MDYWTDSSSLDALSTHSDADDRERAQLLPAPFSIIPPLTSSCLVTPISKQRAEAIMASTESLTLATPVNQPLGDFHQFPKRAFVIGPSLGLNEAILRALSDLLIAPVFVTDPETQLLDADPATDIFLFEEFSGPLFEATRKKSRMRIYGPPYLLKVAEVHGKTELTKFPTSKTGYPVYTTLLNHCKICATGLRNRDELIDIRRKVMYMNGTFLEREGPVMTHLVAARCRGNKYRDAVVLDKPILKPEWVEFLWALRNETELDITKDLERFKVKAFYNAKIALEGFDVSEKAGMVKLIEENEGMFVEPTDPSVTHIVRHSCNSEMSSRRSVSSALTSTTPGRETKPVCGASLDDFGSPQNQSPLKRPRYELAVLNDINETEMETKDCWPDRARILKAEWFWSSIQIEACADENQYQINRDTHNETLNNSLGPSSPFTSPMTIFSDTDGTPNHQQPSLLGKRKRKRLIRNDIVSSFVQTECSKSIMEVDEDIENLQLVKSPEQSHDNVDDNELSIILRRIDRSLNGAGLKAKMEAVPPSTKSFKRLIEFTHLVDTEKNYVTVLMHIVKLFKEPCEADDQKAGRILSSVEIKQIFGPIVPIYELHKRVLRDMLHLLENYTETSLIGHIYVKHAEELRKCYEPFVGYFETVRNEIIRCENENPRFMAFLRIAQAKPQCGKEKLVELIIRPVQRLPSTALVLKNLEKYTEKTNPDFEWVAKGVEAIDRVNQTVNQKKERADARVAIFDVFHEIDGCPVELISDNRTLLKKYDVIALHYDTNGTASTSSSYKNELLTLIVFSDHFQVVKRRNLSASKGGSTLSMANLRSPAVSRKSMLMAKSTSQKRYKFLEWISFSNVKKVANVNDSDPRSFAFIVREMEALRERYLHFTLPEDCEMEKLLKMSVVEFFAKQIARSVSRVDYETFILNVDSNSLTNGVASSGGFISRGIRKVGRALSMSSKTPNKLKRTVSQMISSPFSNTRSRQQDKEKDADSVSQAGSEQSFTPIRNHFSSINIFGTKRGSMGLETQQQHTPKARKSFFDKDGKEKDKDKDSSSSSKRNFPPIDES